MTLALTLALVSGLGYEAMTVYLQDRVYDQEALYHRGQAQALEAVTRGRDWPHAISEIERLIDAASARPGTLEILLIDSNFRVAGAHHRRLVGTRDRDPRIEAAIRDGKSYAGRAANPELDTRDFEFVIPVDLAGRRYAFEASYHHAFFDDEVAGIRRSIALLALLGMFGGCVAFYLLGGRSLMRSHKRALERATRDGLTDLGNQRAFHDELARAVALADRHDEPLTLVLMDIHDFKFLNDRHGRGHGDELLLRVAQNLRGGGSTDRAFRIGGDEFALLLPRTDLEGARRGMRRLQDAFAESHVTVSVGLSTHRQGRDAATLRDEADAALYEAKRRGGGSLLVFEDIQDSVSITTAAKVEALHQLLVERELTVAFQPIWDLDDGSLVGVEALARPSEKYGFGGPAEAFDVAEQIGRVHELDQVCVHKVLAHVDELPAGALLFMNIAPRTLDLEAENDGWLVSAIAASGIDPGRVVIEVTERFGGRLSSVVKSLRRLTAAGLKLALDDVGAGNSGLEMLRRVKVDFVKIDRSVVVGAIEETGARAVLLAMATFANETGSFVIAEGIEDERVLHFVWSLAEDLTVARPRIHGGQGYGLGRPAQSMPPTRNEALTRPKPHLTAA